MDSNAVLRVPAAALAAGNARPTETSVASKGMKVMELAVEATVAPAQPGGDVRNNLARRAKTPVADSSAAQADAAAPASPTVRNIEIDPVTRDVLFQSISRETGEVVAQVPNEQQLKIRHYTRTGEVAPKGPQRIA